MTIEVNERGYPTESLNGKTFTFAGLILPGYVEAPRFTATVLSCNWFFDCITSVEVRVPGHGRRVVPIERITDLQH